MENGSRSTLWDNFPIATAGTFFLFCIAAIKILLLGEHYNISLFSFVSFANLLNFTFNTLRGAMYILLPILIYFNFNSFFHKIQSKIPTWVLWCFLLVNISAAIGIYYGCTLRQPFVLYFKYWCEAGVFSGYILAKRWRMPMNLRLLKISLLIGFFVIYVKCDFKNTLAETEIARKTTVGQIILKPGVVKDSIILLNSNQFTFFNTSDFLFLHNGQTGYNFIVPISNISEISYKKIHY
jgi:hypothetical protein